jgi:hypothetical protein
MDKYLRDFEALLQGIDHAQRRPISKATLSGNLEENLKEYYREYYKGTTSSVSGSDTGRYTGRTPKGYLKSPTR